MQWWNDFVAWLLSDAARPWLFTAVVLFAAVVAAGLLSAWIARRAVRGLIRQRDRELRNSAVAEKIEARFLQTRHKRAEPVSMFDGWWQRA